MEQVELRVKVIKNELTDLEAGVKRLQNTTLNIKVNASGVDALDKKLISAMNAQAKLQDQENKLAIQREKTAQETQKAKRAEAQLAAQMEKTATAEEQARAANARLQQQIQKTTTVEAQAKLQTEKTLTVEKQRQLQIEKTATAYAQQQVQIEKTAQAQARLEGQMLGGGGGSGLGGGGNILSNIGKFTEWYLIGGAVSGAIQSVTDALDTMKEVDSELITVRKVTGASAEELKALEEQAYKTASAYGVAANEYLNSVAAFARAGYKEQSADLAELAVKTQLVGDVTQETANQFLISVDKAYKLNGEVSKLNAVLDGANEIDNKYATSIEKIAEGMGIVAPVASMAHVSVEELTAAIGTITAVTQRSGSEAARAFRALVLNIIGDTKTEIDEGVTWTTGEIAGLRDVIKQYAPEAYEAAKATGSIIDPMEAIGGLAQAMKDGLLTEEKLMAMVSDIGGKLRTSQLLALIENWDMYTSMIEDFQNAMGSADAEVAKALEAWNKKTEQLKDSWTEFISHLVSTEAIKSALDAIIAFLNRLNSEFGEGSGPNHRYTLSEEEQAAVDWAREKYPEYVKAAEEVEKQNEETADSFDDLAGAAEGAGNATQTTEKKYSDSVETIDDVKNAYDALNKAMDEYNTYGGISKSTIDALDAVAPGLISNLYDESGAMSEAGKAALESAGSVQTLALALAQLGVSTAKDNLYQFVDDNRGLKHDADYFTQKAKLAATLADKNQTLQQVEGWIARGFDFGGGGGGGGGGGSSRKDATLEQHKSEISLLKSELTLMEKQGASESSRISKLRQIQSALADQISYMESIGASQEEINKAAGEWWDLQNEIIKLQEEELKSIQKLIDTYYEAQNDALKKKKDDLEKIRDTENDSLKLAEKQLAVEKARANLANAQKERTVRQFNAATGEWEWVANAKNVQAAQDAYDNAVKALSDFRAELDYKAKKAEIDSQIDYNKKLSSALEDAIQNFIKAINNGGEGADDAFNALLGVLNESELKSTDLYEQIIIALMKANSLAWFTSGPEEQSRLHNYNNQLGSMIGANYSGGAWYKNGMLLYSVDESGGSSSTLYNPLSQNQDLNQLLLMQQMQQKQQSVPSYSSVGSDGNAPAGLSVGTIVNTAGGGFQIVNPGTPGATYNPASGYYSIKVYDTGGVLDGLGGIKATKEDEMVLPPDITAKMLSPTMDMNTKSRFEELRYLYGISNETPRTMSGVGTQYNGPVNSYTLNGITIGESEAKGMSVYEFAKMTKALNIFSAQD